AETRERVTGPDTSLQQARHLLQHPVTGRVAEGVVDDLELVEVDVDQGVLDGWFAAGLGERRVQPLLKLAAVDEPGERIVGRLVRKRAFEPPLAADVPEHDDGPEQPAFAVADRCRGVLDRDLTAGAINERALVVADDDLRLPEAPRREALGRLA